MAVKKKKKKTKSKAKLTPEQKRNSDIFRLRGFYSNAKTLPFGALELKAILSCVDTALIDLGAQSQTDYLYEKQTRNTFS